MTIVGIILKATCIISIIIAYQAMIIFIKLCITDLPKPTTLSGKLIS